MPSATTASPQHSDAPIRPALDRALTETLAKLPPSSGRGFVQLDVATTGARLEAGHRLTQGWTAGGWAGLAWGQRWAAGVRLSGSW